MRLERVGTVFLVLGLIVGVAATLGLALDVVPRLSPFMLKVVVYKLSFIGALVLLVAGAVIRRAARRDERAGSGAA